jgi:pSer/pThr/pTyr-binding forkhead associated (FHA) protein
VIGEGERVFVLGEKTVSIGRGEHCDIVLLEQSVSRNHARVEHDDGSYVIIDDGSASGIHVGGQRVARRRLADGDEIEIGDTKIQFVVSAHSQPTIGGAKVRPTEIATNPPPSKQRPTEPVAAPARRPTSDFEGAATWASDEPLPSGQETQMPTDV